MSHFHMTQIMSGHGCFGSFLHKIGKIDDPTCAHCGIAEDTADHTLSDCSSWDEERASLLLALDVDILTLGSVVAAILRNKECWFAFSHFCTSVMLSKENAERERKRMRRNDVGSNGNNSALTPLK
ncbi:PREDICTED: uncharacterized protein LOC105556687 [Vollenhovia emeryi]|uniref:uncharacterized protein LOC105556687 n=1 Tax=Vollenhovia emeryi TaxID=411798 RepID=UPI0005F4D369|nr:PREDICTED: uncharacterized protein LOC105556687 [Vollenhovia emeryi]